MYFSPRQLHWFGSNIRSWTDTSGTGTTPVSTVRSGSNTSWVQRRRRNPQQKPCSSSTRYYWVGYLVDPEKEKKPPAETMLKFYQVLLGWVPRGSREGETSSRDHAQVLPGITGSGTSWVQRRRRNPQQRPCSSSTRYYWVGYLVDPEKVIGTVYPNSSLKCNL